jgi:hypothetical protein
LSGRVAAMPQSEGAEQDFADQLWPTLILWQILQSALVVRWGNP